MKDPADREIPEVEHVVIEEIDEEEESEREFDPRSKSIVRKAGKTQRSLVDESSEYSTESDNVPIVKSKGRSPRIIIKKTVPAAPAPSKPKRKIIATPEPTRVQKRRKFVPSRTRIPSPPSASPPRAAHDEDESVRSLVLRMMKDFEDFKMRMMAEVRSVKDEMMNIPRLVKEELLKEGWTGRGFEKEYKAAEENVMFDEPMEFERTEAAMPEFVATEPIVSEIVRFESPLPMAFQLPIYESEEDVEIVDVSRLSESEAKKVVESRFSADGKAIMSNAERKTIEKLYKTEQLVFLQNNMQSVISIDRRRMVTGKGKEVVVADSAMRLGEAKAVNVKRVPGSEIVTFAEGMLLESALKNLNFEYPIFEGTNRWFYPVDHYSCDKLNKKYLSLYWQDLSTFEPIDTSNTVLIEDVNVEELMEAQEMIRQIKLKMSREKNLYEKILKLEVVERVKERLSKDAEFEKIFNRLRAYFGEKADDAFYYEPEEIISLCTSKDNEKMAQTLHDVFKMKKPSQDEIVADLMFNVDTLTAAELKKFLKKHGFSSYELNKKMIEDMKEDAKSVQFNLIKMLNRDQAEALLDSGEFNLPEGYDNRARFFSSQFPFISAYRIVHWRYDADKECFMVKRVTGATHVLYTMYEVARLTEEDLYEIADLPLHNPSKNERAYMFARFLKRQKQENFDAINFDNPESIRAETLRYLKAEGMTMREIMRDQYLCMKFEHVPKKSTVNLLDNLSRWFLDEKSFEFVIERKNEDTIRFYHPAELNMFTREDLIKISKTQPVGKRIWNCYIIEMLQGVLENLIACLPDENQLQMMRKEAEKKDKKKQKKRRGQSEASIRIAD